jgi:uncharacterized protein (DUF58 family)
VKLLAFAILLALIVALVYLLALAFQKIRTERVVEHGQWTVKERALPGRRIGVYLLKPGEAPVLFGEPISQKLSQAEFEDQLITVRIAAQDRADTLNRRIGQEVT